MPLTDILANARHGQSVIIFFIIMRLKKKVVGGNGARCVEARMMKCFLSCTHRSAVGSEIILDLKWPAVSS